MKTCFPILLLLHSVVTFSQTALHITHGCAYKTAAEETTLYTFQGSEEVERIVREICGAMVLKPNFDLKAASVDNALATAEGGRRIILYSEVFLQQFNLDARTRWAAYSVLAHEIGHHLNNHDFSEPNAGKRKLMELEADQFSGAVLRLLGASLEEAQAGINTFAREAAQTRHPSAKSRREAISVGWTQQQELILKLGGGNVDPGTGALREHDTDGDGIADSADACPEQFGRALTTGCPDGDEDGIPDRDDKCPYRKGPSRWSGCPDTDGDGINDHEDACPDKPGDLKDKGCPPPDRDADGVYDRVDQCPDAKGMPQYQGCPDSDGDGVPDPQDKCPKDKGEPWREGCPNETPVPNNTDIPDNMVFIPGGTFQMGSADIGEIPVHAVTVSSFYMSKYELTVAEFKQFMEATGYQTDADKDGWSYVWTGSNYEQKKGVNWRCDAKGNPRSTSEYNHPVIHVSWNDAVAYCQWKSKQTGKNYRLPTEAEWEYAAGGGAPKGHSRTLWAGTSDEDQLRQFANHYSKEEGDKYDYTAPVGSLKPNVLGLYDMSGNVSEWCSDRYHTYSSSAQTNPTGATSGSSHVFRGGYWGGSSRYCLVACRDGGEPDNRSGIIGLRLVFQ